MYCVLCVFSVMRSRSVTDDKNRFDMENTFSKRELELLLGSLRTQIATMRTLWRSEKLPNVVPELEELQRKVAELEIIAVKRDFICDKVIPPE